MKRLLVIVLVSIVLTSCFDEVDNSLDRDSFIGNYDFTLSCDDNSWNGTHIIFIEKPMTSKDTLESTIIIRNLLNQNNTIQAIVSDKDLIFNDDQLIGTGTLDVSSQTITISFSFTDTNCSGTGTLRE